jgi:hypothetical protein
MTADVWDWMALPHISFLKASSPSGCKNAHFFRFFKGEMKSGMGTAASAEEEEEAIIFLNHPKGYGKKHHLTRQRQPKAVLALASWLFHGEEQN